MDHSYTASRYRSNDISSLYIIETNSDFVPGYVSYYNGDTTYSRYARNSSGYVHVLPRQAVDEIDQSTIRYGGVPLFKDAWPINNCGTITIVSTYSSNLTLGYSFKNGFSLDNITIEGDSSKGANIGYSYAKSYTTTEPRLSAQHGSTDYNEYQWFYHYVDSANGDETYHIQSGYMFEMNNSNHELIGEGQFGITFNFKMTVEYYLQYGALIPTDPFTGYLYVG